MGGYEIQGDSRPIVSTPNSENYNNDEDNEEFINKNAPKNYTSVEDVPAEDDDMLGVNEFGVKDPRFVEDDGDIEKIENSSKDDMLMQKYNEEHKDQYVINQTNKKFNPENAQKFKVDYGNDLKYNDKNNLKRRVPKPRSAEEITNKKEKVA